MDLGDGVWSISGGNSCYVKKIASTAKVTTFHRSLGMLFFIFQSPSMFNPFYKRVVEGRKAEAITTFPYSTGSILTESLPPS